MKKPYFSMSMATKWTGYDKATMKNFPKLITLCLRVHEKPDYRPVVEEGKVVKTFCNEAVREIAEGMGCNDFQPNYLADDIFEFIQAPGHGWKEVMMRDVQSLVNQGSLVIAAMTSKMLNAAHGHVCVCRPGEAVWSEHWKSMVPACVNIGQQVFILRFKTSAGEFIEAGVNGAFTIIPHFFLWSPSE